MTPRYFLTAGLIAAFLFSMATAPASASPDKDDPTLEEIISKHLDSIGTSEARSAVKSRVILGTAVATFRIGGKGQANGRAVLASQSDKSLIGIAFDYADYPHEKMGYDGKVLRVADITPGNRSTLGTFFMNHEMPFKDGLLAGTLSTAWPVLNISAMKGKLKSEGSKKIDGRKVYVVRYDTKNDTGLKTKLYFDAETFRHVRTEYEQRIIQQMASAPGVTQQQGDSITKLTEDYSDFQTKDGLTLPHVYKLQLSIETLNRRVLQDWVFTLSQFVANRVMDDKEFDVTSK